VTTVKQYTTRLRSGVQKVALRFGTDLNGSTKTLRAVVMGVLVMIAVVVKTIVDKGVVSDAELLATFQAAEDEAQDGEPDLP